MAAGDPVADQEHPTAPGDVERFWTLARRQARIETLPGYLGPSTLEVLAPPTWSFGETPEQADALLDLVLDGTKTATSSALRDHDDGALPQVGSIDIVLDSSGRPRALLKTTGVEVVAFDEVDEEHARLEGEGDLTLEHWREVHERFFTTTAPEGAEEFAADLPVVLERFEVLYQE